MQPLPVANYIILIDIKVILPQVLPLSVLAFQLGTHKNWMKVKINAIDLFQVYSSILHTLEVDLKKRYVPSIGKGKKNGARDSTHKVGFEK